VQYSALNHLNYDKVKNSLIYGVIFKFSSWYGLAVENHNRLFNASIYALLTHLLIFGCLVVLTRKIQLEPQIPVQDRAMQIDKISRAQLNRYRKVGVRGGVKGFNMKAKRGNTVSKGKNNPSTVLPSQVGIRGVKAPGSKENPRGKNSGPQLSMDQLRAKIDPSKIKKIPQVDEQMRQTTAENQVSQKLTQKQEKILIKREIQAAEHGIPLTALRSSQAVNNFRRQQQIQFGMLRDMAPQSSQAEILKNTGFNLHFEPPEGIPEDELNSVEKIFYGFQKRTFIGYVNSFMSSYNEAINSYPQIKNTLRSEHHLLTGRITFDKEGNIVRIKILRSSENDEVHKLFEKTLLNIRSLPNPPKAIIKDKDEFDIYYQLKIN